MSSSEGDLRLPDLLRGRSVAEHLLNVLKAGLASTPFAGGIASLLSDYIPAAKIRRLEDFARTIGEDLTKLEHRVDADYVTTDGFAYMFEQCFKGVAEQPQEAKRSAFRGILVNSAINRTGAEEERELFLNLVNGFTSLHLRILKFMAMPEEYLEQMGISPDEIRGGFSSFFPVAMPGVSLDAIKTAYGELYRSAMISTDTGIFSTMTSGQGLELLRGRVTPFGERFIRFCSSPAE